MFLEMMNLSRNHEMFLLWCYLISCGIHEICYELSPVVYGAVLLKFSPMKCYA